MNIINNNMIVLKQLLFLCIGVSISQFLQWPRFNITGSHNSSNKATINNNRKPKLGDGCKHVFLDVGSNIGVHSRILYEPHLYPKLPTNRFSSRKFFANRFGSEDERDNRNICIFAFEPNPAHIKRHKELERAYNALGWRYHFIHGGVGDTSSTITFYHIGKGNKKLERGFSMAKERCRKKCIPEEVMVYRLSDWIDNEIHDRIIPEDTDENHSSPIVKPMVIMKMDIEMSEWIVLPDLITSGVLCRDIDTLLIEVHLLQHKNDYPIHFAQHNWTLGNVEARKLKEGMFGMVQRNPSCKTELVQGDDEYYGDDGMPLPTKTTYHHSENTMMKDTPL